MTYFDEYHPTYTMKIALLSPSWLEDFYFECSDLHGDEQSSYLIRVENWDNEESWITPTTANQEMLKFVNSVMSEAKELGLDFILWTTR